MCGACGTARGSWADPVLSRAHARPVVARLTSALSGRLRVRPAASGWTLTRDGSARTAVCRGAAELAAASAADVRALLEAEGRDALRARLLADGRHRPVLIPREAFPAGAVASAAPSSDPVPADLVIPHVLFLCLLDAAGARPEPVALLDPRGPWLLRPAHAGAAAPAR